MENALVTMTLLSLSLMLTGGFYVKIPVWLEWIKYISPFKYNINDAFKLPTVPLQLVCRYGYASLVLVQFKGLKTQCDGSDILPSCVLNPSGSANGAEVLSFLDIQVSRRKK